MGGVQRTGAGSKPRIDLFRVVSKPDSNHWSGYYGHRTLGLTPAGTICHSTRSLGYYPLRRDTYVLPGCIVHRTENLCKFIEVKAL